MEYRSVGPNGDVHGCSFNFDSRVILEGIKAATIISLSTGVLFAANILPLFLKYVPVLTPFGAEPTFWTGAANGTAYALTAFSYKYISVLFCTNRPHKCTVLNNLLIGYALTTACVFQAKQYFGG